MAQFNVLSIIGVGLIGGSIGLAAKKRGLVRTVRGLGRQQASLDKALAAGAIDAAYLEPHGAVAGADLIVFCTPVDQIAKQIIDFANHYTPQALITDAGSTKGRIVREVEAGLPGQVHFVGSHPLAGSEKRGPEFADANLFQNRWTVLTPTQRTNPQALARMQGFWTGLGCRVKQMTPDDHDRALALTSHVPHLVAAVLAGALPAELFDLAATGFRDTTRIAAGDPALWTAIFQHNRDAMLASLSAVSVRLGGYRAALEQNDWARIDQLLAEAKRVRDALGS
jgi:cyclohexadieny/prephenate dehydrogenase